MSLLTPVQLSTKRRTLWALVLFGVVATILLVCFYIFSKDLLKNPVVIDTQDQEDSIVTDAQIEIESVADGDLVLSFVVADPEDTSKTGVSSHIYNTVSSTNWEVPLIKQVDTAENTISVFQLSFAPDLSSAVFFGISGAGFVSEDDAIEVQPGTPVLYRATINPDEFSSHTDLHRILTQAEMISIPDESDSVRMSPVVSAEANILYSSLSESLNEAAEDMGSVEANSWDINLITAEGEKTVLTQGLYPKWIDETSFGFIKNDGVYTYNLLSKEEKRVWENVGSINTLTNGFDIANDEQYFVWSNPQESKLAVYAVESWEEGVTSLYSESPVAVANPVFSPDDQHIAVTLTRTTEAGDKNLALEYYSMLDKSFINTKTLIDDETITGVYLTDWQ